MDAATCDETMLFLGYQAVEEWANTSSEQPDENLTNNCE